MEIIKTQSSDELSEYKLKDVVRLNPDWFVYRYTSYTYEGSGVAVWKKDGKYFHTELGHCSCNGPLDGIDSVIPYEKLEDIEKIIGNSYGDKEGEVIKLIKEKYV